VLSASTTRGGGGKSGLPIPKLITGLPFDKSVRTSFNFLEK
jgi:hypothetical protein